MQYVNFGSAGVKVSRVALGMGLRGQSDEKGARELVAAALDLGVNLLDCANIYGLGDDRRLRGTSEMLLGKALQGRRDEVVITSKVRGAVGDGPNDVGLSRYHILREAERTLKRLNTDRIDVYLIHGPDETTPLEETLRALDSLVQQGKVRYVGVCNHQAWQVVQTLRVQERLNAAALITLQNPYNLLNRDLEREIFPMVAEMGLGLMAFSPLAVGLLSGAYQPDTMPEEDSLWGGRREHAFQNIVRDRVAEVIAEVLAVAERVGATPGQVAQAWILSHPEVTCIISGADIPAHIEDTVGSVELELPAEEIRRLDGVSKGLQTVLDGSVFEPDR